MLSLLGHNSLLTHLQLKLSIGRPRNILGSHVHHFTFCVHNVAAALTPQNELSLIPDDLVTSFFA